MQLCNSRRAFSQIFALLPLNVCRVKLRISLQKTFDCLFMHFLHKCVAAVGLTPIPIGCLKMFVPVFATCERTNATYGQYYWFNGVKVL